MSLPRLAALPRGGFEERHSHGTRVLRSRLLEASGVPHAFGTRLGGASEGPYQEANRGFSTRDRPEAVAANWAALLAAAGLPGVPLGFVRQVHGTEVRWAARDGGQAAAQGPGFRDLGPGDGVALRQPGMAAAVVTADCVPVLVAFDLPTGAPGVAALHSGWRGTVADLVGGFLAGHQVEVRAVAIGPHIRSCCFEIGPEVAERVASTARALGIEVDRVLSPGKDDRSHADLETLVGAQLARAGVAGDRIDRGAPCTVCDGDRFFSYRRQGPGHGLLGHAIGLGSP